MKALLWGVVLVFTVSIVLLLIVGFSENPSATASPLLNKSAPAFTLRSMDGKPVSLSALRGRPVLVNFWASWCDPCKVEHRYLVDAWRAFGSQGVQFLGVSYQDSRSAARAFMRARGGSWPVLDDPGGITAIDYGVTGVPETFLIDRRGVVRYKSTGPITPGGPETPAILDSQLAQLVKIGA